MYSCLQTLGYNVHGNEQATIEDITQINTKSVVSFAKIVEFVSTYYNVSVTDLKSPKRSKEISQARQMLMVIAKNHFNRTLEKIGDYFGGKNHATVIYAVHNFNRKVKNDTSLSHDYNIIMERIQQ